MREGHPCSAVKLLFVAACLRDSTVTRLVNMVANFVFGVRICVGVIPVCCCVPQASSSSLAFVYSRQCSVGLYIRTTGTPLTEPRFKLRMIV